MGQYLRAHSCIPATLRVREPCEAACRQRRDATLITSCLTMSMNLLTARGWQIPQIAVALRSVDARLDAVKNSPLRAAYSLRKLRHRHKVVAGLPLFEKLFHHRRQLVDLDGQLP